MKNFTASLLHTAWTEEEKYQLDRTINFVEDYSGSNFLPDACQLLYRILGIDYIQIGIGTKSNLKDINTVVRLLYGQLVPNISFNLSNTPFNAIFSEEFMYFPFGLSALYPESETINKVKAESFVSMPLYNTANQPLGLIIMLHSRIIERGGFVEALLNTLAPRIEADLSSSHLKKSVFIGQLSN